MSAPFTPEQEARLREIIREEWVECDLATTNRDDTDPEDIAFVRGKLSRAIGKWFGGARG